jgi:hypothetical protein
LVNLVSDEFSGIVWSWKETFIKLDAST